MVRASRQQLTSSEEEMDAFTAVMLSVEFELKKIAFNALKTTRSNSPETTKPGVLPPVLCHNEGQHADTPKPEIVP